MLLLLLNLQPAVVVAAPNLSAGIGSGEKEYHGLAIDALIAQKNQAQAIAKVALSQASNPVNATNPAKQNRQLKREIERAGLPWNGFYTDVLAQARSKALTELIRSEANQQRIDLLKLQAMIEGFAGQSLQYEDDEAAIMLLL